MMQIASIRQIELLAMLALPLHRTLHRQTQEFESPLIQALLPPEIEENRPPQRKKRNMAEQKEEKFLLEPMKKIRPAVSAFQTVEFIGLSNRCSQKISILGVHQ